MRIKILAFVGLPCGEKLNAQLKTIATGGVPRAPREVENCGVAHVGNLIELICAHAKEFSSG